MKKHIVCFGDSNTHGYCAMNDGRFDESRDGPAFFRKIWERIIWCLRKA